MVYYCRFCEKSFDKTKPTVQQREAFYQNRTAYNYPGLYQHIEEAHGYKKDGATGKLIGMGFVEPYKIFRFEDKKGAGKGWREAQGASGKAPEHQKAALKGKAKGAQNTPMKQKPSKLVIQNINSMPIQKDTIALAGITDVTSPQNFQPIKQLTLGNTVYLYYDQPFRVVKKSGSIEVLPTDGKGHFIMIEDRMGFITLSHSDSKRVAFFQAESDTDFIKDLLKKGEKEDLENGYEVQINDSEPRASTLSELWEASGGGGD